MTVCGTTTNKLITDIKSLIGGRFLNSKLFSKNADLNIYENLNREKDKSLKKLLIQKIRLEERLVSKHLICFLFLFVFACMISIGCLQYKINCFQTSLQDENNKLWSVIVVRGQLEDVEFEIRTVFV